MAFYDLIMKKRDGGELTPEEWEYVIGGLVRREIPDYQVAALLMAVYFKGLTAREMAEVAMVMARSGKMLDLSGVPGIKVDKHSTGGVGDKTTLVVLPVVAAAGVPVVKISGRGLGHTGGTIDKLESIPGLKTELTPEELVQAVRQVGMAISAQTDDFVPADRELYSLRDVTATVDSVPLIATSIMSKKLAAGADCIVLDVKVGQGAFMKSEQEAKELARAMVTIGEINGRRTVAVISRMDQPLGRAVGNALEVQEAVEVLEGDGPGDLRELALKLAGIMIFLGGRTGSLEEGYAVAERALSSGQAADVFWKFVVHQGGCRFESLARASQVVPFLAPESGYVSRVDALAIGRAAVCLGAGRRVKGERVDPAVGVVLRKKVGERVKQGEVLAEVHANETGVLGALEAIKKAYSISPSPPEIPPLVLGVVGKV